MQAVQFEGHGGPEVVTYSEYPKPDPDRGEVVVDVKAGALNHLDVWTRNGLPGLDLDMPHVPGSDAAGVVAEVGPDVTRFAPGDRVAVWAGVSCEDCEFCRRGEDSMCVDYEVMGEHRPGVHAERVTVPADNLVDVPDGVDWTTAAAAPLVFATAWRMVVTRADVSPGESVLVLGASGGVGHAAVQIADFAGADVFATASTAKKREYARELGADHAIDYQSWDFADAVRELTDKRGVDVVVDHVAGETWRQSLRSLAMGGRLVTCGATAGPQPETDVPRLFGNQLTVLGSTMATPVEVDDALRHVWDGTFEMRVRETLPMSETARGHDLLEDRDGFGKVVVVPDSEYGDG